MKQIIVRKCGDYLDGGTEEYRGEDGKLYFIDRRIETKTPGAVYNDYPGDEGAKILSDVVLVTRV